MTLSVEQWRECYRILQNDHGWKSNLSEIESRCKRGQTTCEFPLGFAWPMAATIRETNEELADEIRRQMNAQLIWEWIDA